MDNLTHSLIGAALGQAGLKRRTGLAMPALIVAANLPDIDAGCVVFGVESLAMRRGITHGPIALAVLPLLLAGGLMWFDKWQMRRGKRPETRPPVRFGWLLALCYIGVLTHPLFDWFNNYGIRLLEPFSHRWFYGDTLFIIDPWIIAMLGLGIWLSLRRERDERPHPGHPSIFALCLMVGYVAFNSYISNMAVNRATSLLGGARPQIRPVLIVANAKPILFWQREILWRSDQTHGRGDYDAFHNGATLDKDEVFYLLPPSPGMAYFSDDHPAGPYRISAFDTGMGDPRILRWSKDDPAARAFLFWSRMPIAELHDDRIVLRDQRFVDPRVARNFSVTLRPPR